MSDNVNPAPGTVIEVQSGLVWRPAIRIIMLPNFKANNTQQAITNPAYPDEIPVSDTTTYTVPGGGR